LTNDRAQPPGPPRQDHPAGRSTFRFSDLFGREAALSVDAPGRVNLIGEHTDYNGGFVLPAVIPQRTRLELAPRDDMKVRAWSVNVGSGTTHEVYEIGREARGRGWLDYLQGITVVLTEAGHALRGVDVRVESEVPVGSGLSSSAALEVAFARGLRTLFGLELDNVSLARLSQRAENEFVGAPVGIMDQMAASIARDGSAVFLDTRTLEFEEIPLMPTTELVVIHSGISHSHQAGDYATRRRECEQASLLLEVPQLRDLDLADLPRIESIPDPYRQRARHVVTENARVLDAVAAIRSQDPVTLGRLFHESHVSMRDDFRVSVAEIDLLVDLAESDPDVYGARLTGGGFGGSIVALARLGSATAVARRIVAAYSERCSAVPSVLLPRHLSSCG
jgi:galactokinase